MIRRSPQLTGYHRYHIYALMQAGHHSAATAAITGEHESTSAMCGFINTSARTRPGWRPVPAPVLQDATEEALRQLPGRPVNTVSIGERPALWTGRHVMDKLNHVPEKHWIQEHHMRSFLTPKLRFKLESA